MAFMFLPNEIDITLEEKLMCRIQFHPLLVFVDISNGVL